MRIELTANAVEKVKAFAQEHGDDGSKGLCVFVQGGGCSGFEYGFDFDLPQDTDNIIDAGPVKVLIDPYSAPYIKDSVIDYMETFMKTGFVVTNPNAKATCGCGLSFSV